MSKNERWVTTAEAAEYMGLTEYTVRELLRRRELRGCQVNNRWRTRLTWCDAYLMEGVNLV